MENDCDLPPCNLPCWGFVLNGKFIEIQKLPLWRAGYRQPPFHVTPPGHERPRYIIEEP